MKKSILLLLAALLAGGCSLTGDDAPDGVAGLRLLVGGGQHKTVSDPDANDWSPQMVYIGTNRYLYFLSDRGFAGSTFNGMGMWISNTKVAGSVGIFRAFEVQPGVYSNMQLLHTFGAGTNVAAIIKPVTNASGVVDCYAIVKENGSHFTNVYLQDGSSAPPVIYNYTMYEDGSYDALFPAGCIYDPSAGEVFCFFGKKINYYGDYDSFQYLQLAWYEGGGIMLMPYGGNAILSFEQTAGNNAGFDLLRGRELLGAWPANFHRPTDGKRCFGFYVSYGGVLSVLLYRQYQDSSEFCADGLSYDLYTSNPDIRQLVIAYPLLRVTHYAGTIDRNPSYDPATGLYFSSNRDGKYNLYLVPKELLYLPEWLAMPDIMVGP